MSIFLKTPFRSNKLETDPLVYGLRPEIIRIAVMELFNDKSVLITGARGIGKSSLCYQLQRIINGDKTILQRCGMDVDFGKYITISYVCTPHDTLETLIKGIMKGLEHELDVPKKKFKAKESTIEVSLLGMIKASTKIENTDSDLYGTLLDNFVSVMKQFGETYVAPHINIAIDELDQLPYTENIAHFLKASLERLLTIDVNFLSFILVGQEELFERLYEQQPAFHRFVKHIQLYPLSKENAESVFDACLNRAQIPLEINDNAKGMVLDLSGGYPAVIQLLGHETFNCSLERFEKTPTIIVICLEDVLQGVKNAIIGEAVRFDTILGQLTGEEKNCLLTLATDETKRKAPWIFEFSNILDGIPIRETEDKKKIAINIVTSLIEKQILIFVKNDIMDDITQKKFCFREELFRVYIFDKMHNEERLDFD